MEGLSVYSGNPSFFYGFSTNCKLLSENAGIFYWGLCSSFKNYCKVCCFCELHPCSPDIERRTEYISFAL